MSRRSGEEGRADLKCELHADQCHVMEVFDHDVFSVVSEVAGEGDW